uniref:Uncharacterized protein n=1 Tax=Diacronema lutheri TaxID=2081491 RepID=A0A7R9UHK5_DIALT|mmetsp:Transcript_11052/g.34893  ORF Transcript_11052/g.34893 Transcript_11052/m.34893 type:complete len:301 (+) Transcript_11052:376-1278(+)
MRAVDARMALVLQLVLAAVLPDDACLPAANSRAAAPPIPNAVHQPWLGGADLRWEQVLAMASVRYVMRPEHFTLYYDVRPRDTPAWRCACALADACVRTPSRATIFGQRVAYAQHRSDLMRLDLLEAHGGVYVDHDSFVLRPLDGLRACSAGVIGGLEHFSREEVKFNNGVLLAAANASFLRVWRESYRDYRPNEWDWNSCRVPAALWRASPGLALALPTIAPLPRFAERAAYDAHLAWAHVVHATGLLNAPWRQADMRAYGVMRAIAARILAAVHGGRASGDARRCAEVAVRRVNSTWR